MADDEIETVRSALRREPAPQDLNRLLDEFEGACLTYAGGPTEPRIREPAAERMVAARKAIAALMGRSAPAPTDDRGDEGLSRLLENASPDDGLRVIRSASVGGRLADMCIGRAEAAEDTAERWRAFGGDHAEPNATAFDDEARDWRLIAALMSHNEPRQEAVGTLWLCDAHGNLYALSHHDDGSLQVMPDPDDVPDSLKDDAPTGFSVYEGGVRTLSAEDLGGDDHPYGDLEPGDLWWDGSLRPATPAEVLAFFGLHATSSGEPEKPNDGATAEH